MNSRERIIAALNHVQPDKVPIDCGGHRSSSFSVQAYKNLREYLSMPKSDLYVYAPIEQLVYPDQDVLELFGIDVIGLGRDFIYNDDYWKDWTMHDGTSVKIPKFVDIRDIDRDSVMYNSKGRPIAIQKEHSLYFEQSVFPREDDDSDDFSNLEENFRDVVWLGTWVAPSPLGYEGEDFLFRREYARKTRANTDRAIYAYGPVGCCFFEATQYIMGMRYALQNLAARPKLMHKFLDKLLEVFMRDMEREIASCGDSIDIIGLFDDYGMQTGLMISPNMYREFFKPMQKELCSFTKKLKPNVKICLHSCGAVGPLIGDFIEAGIDAINPVQTSCAGMDLVKLKKEYGRDITFWGGGCDTTEILPYGTPSQVRDHVLKNLDVMFKDGGYVFQQTHNILADVPPENIVAMFEAVREYA